MQTSLASATVFFTFDTKKGGGGVFASVAGHSARPCSCQYTITNSSPHQLKAPNLHAPPKQMLAVLPTSSSSGSFYNNPQHQQWKSQAHLHKQCPNALLEELGWLGFINFPILQAMTNEQHTMHRSPRTAKKPAIPSSLLLMHVFQQCPHGSQQKCPQHHVFVA